MAKDTIVERYTAARDLPAVNSNDLSLSKQLDYNTTVKREPCSILFLTGKYAGQNIDTGVLIGQTDIDQSVDIAANNESNIRVGGHLARVMPRSITFSIMFWDEREDIAQLSEMIAALQEIDPETHSTPLVLFKQGKLEANQCLCSNLHWKYEHPFNGSNGFAYVVVDVTLELYGGVLSPHAFAVPLAPNKLTQQAKETTPEQQEQNQNKVIADLLFPCLGEDSSRVQDLLNSTTGINDVNSLKNLPIEALGQLIISGLIDKSTLNNLDDYLLKALATIIVNNLPGLSGFERQKLIQALMNKTAPNSYLDSEYIKIKDSFDQILEAILGDGISETSPIMSPTSQAGQILRDSTSCGISILNVTKANKPSNNIPDEQQQKLDTINEFLSEASLTEIQDKFKVKTTIEADTIKQNFPYESQEEFVLKSSASDQTSGLVLWENFQNTED